VKNKVLAWIALAAVGVQLAGPAPVVLAAEDEPAYRISLAEALRTALENNYGLVSASYNPELAELDVKTARSEFDYGLETYYDRGERSTAPTSTFTITDTATDQAVLGVNKTTSFGMTFGANYTLFRQTQEIPPDFPPTIQVSPETYFATLGITATMPLLKGRGKATARLNLTLSENDVDVEVRDLEGQAEQTLEIVEGAYWDVLASIRAVEVANKAHQRAADFLDLNKKQVEVGTLAPIEVTRAEAQMAGTEENVIVAEVGLEDAEDELLRLMAVPVGDRRWEARIEPADQPVFQAVEIDVEQAIDVALQSRPEVINARQTLDNSDLTVRARKRDVKHGLDLSGGYTAQGSSIQGIPTDDGTLSEAAGRVFDGEEFNWNTRLTYRVPIANRAAKADYARAKIQFSRSEVGLADQEQTVRVEVRKSARAVTSGMKRVEAARKTVDLQKKTLEAEERKFENGMSTSFEVLSSQSDLADAELTAIRAGLDYLKALAAFERSKGVLLESRGLNIMDLQK
jgi:outer membrane protein TolC